MRNQTWGEPGSPDIYVIGYFVSIVDSNRDFILISLCNARMKIVCF